MIKLVTFIVSNVFVCFFAQETGENEETALPVHISERGHNGLHAEK